MEKNEENSTEIRKVMSKLSQFISLIKLMIIMVILTGFIYPLSLNIVGNLFFPWQAGGSLFIKNKKIIGSILIGQNFKSDRYFHSRHSYAGEGYESNHSGASNLAINNARFNEIINYRANILIKNNSFLPIASDEIFASASGLDPHISPINAYRQISRIAKARKIKLSDLQNIVDEHIKNSDFYIIGSPRINVLLLNHNLDSAIKNYQLDY